MSHVHIGKRAVAICCMTLVAMTTHSSHADLTKAQIKILEHEFLPAWKVGNTWGVLESLNKAVRTMNDQQLVELDELLAAQGIPSSGQLMLESRLTLLRQNLGKKLPRPGTGELLMTLEYVGDEVQKLINESVTLIGALDQLTPDNTFENFDDLLWNTHVMTQQVQSSTILAEYAVHALENKKRIKLDKLSAKQKELLETDFQVLVDELNTVQKALGEQELVARIKRLKHAMKTLGRVDADRKEQFLAAWAVNLDGDLIREALNTDIEFDHEMLQADDLLPTIQDLSNRGNKLAGAELLQKSQLLFEGLHWWYRGRYGMGTDAFGLLKSPEAVVSDEAAFALMMPVEPPTPTNPIDDSRYQIPEIDRRHHYIWAWEYRTVGVNRSKERRVIDRHQAVTQETELARFY